MKDSTKAQFDAILKAAQEKANSKGKPLAATTKSQPAAQKQATAPQQQQPPAPVPQPRKISVIPPADNKPPTIVELSNTTIDDLLNNNTSGKYCAPVPFQLPAVKTATAPAAVAPMLLIDYSPRSFAIIDPRTYQIRNELRQYGTYNRFLTHNGTRAEGWIFSKKYAAVLQKIVNRFKV